MLASLATLHVYSRQAILRRIWPVLRDCAMFFEDFLVEAPDGWLTDANGKDSKYLVIAPSTSCENTYYVPGTRTAASITVGSSWDSQILYELFTACLQATELLGDGNALLDDSRRYKDILDHLSPARVGKHGQVQEWAQDYEEAEPGHRHISHAFGLYPGYSLKSARLQDALRVTLQRRLAAGGGHTGWSAAWLLCLYARLRNPEEAMRCLADMLIAHSTLPNLLGDHPPFHIDGSFGLAAGVEPRGGRGWRRRGQDHTLVTVLASRVGRLRSDQGPVLLWRIQRADGVGKRSSCSSENYRGENMQRVWSKVENAMSHRSTLSQKWKRR